MNFEKLQEMIKDIIDREMEIEFEYDFAHMTEEQDSKNKEYMNKVDKIQKYLEKKLDNEGQELLRDLIDTLYLQATTEGGYYFERGVRCGLTTLSYLKKYCQWF